MCERMREWIRDFSISASPAFSVRSFFSTTDRFCVVHSYQEFDRKIRIAAYDEVVRLRNEI